MDYPYIDGRRYRNQQVGTATISEVWGDYIVQAQSTSVEPNTSGAVEFHVTDFSGNPTTDEISFFINDTPVTTVKQRVVFPFSGKPHGEIFLTAHGDNIKGVTATVTVNATTPSISDEIASLKAVQADILLALVMNDLIA